jgi:medium-chain acyl-[acyl-carrier-protein] hydrolase
MMKLICFPYAGGSATVFLKMKKYLDSSIDLCPIEYPGRGFRMDEDFIFDSENFISDMKDQMDKVLLHDEPFMVLGYSMGTLITLEIINRMKLKPRHAFLCAYEPPEYALDDLFDISKESKFDFLKHLLVTGGITQDFINDSEIQKTFFPQIIADYWVLNSFKKQKNKAYPIIENGTVMYTQNDDPDNQIGYWKKYVKNINFCQFIGDHFFINRDYPKICNIINQTYKKL